ncbi:thioesterase II family protein [Streptomyces sp. BI20]|uniref:thioesterase II family protein n=1 Tax=Streptomyces sp. BI20 TaxID=3403460 RepID=UPI003C786336
MDSLWFRTVGQTADGHSEALRLVCFPHAGGSAGTYVPLTRALAPEIEVRAVQYPGRQDRRRETPVADLLDLAGRIAERLHEAGPRPFAFFGHSMGALLAFETARALRAAGRPLPVRLFLSGRGAPTGSTNPHDVMPDDAAILRAVRMLGGAGAGLLEDPELRDLALPALRADYRALAAHDWRPEPPLEVPITVLTGREDPVVPTAEAARWAEQTTAAEDTRVFPGGHFYLDDHLADVADVVRERLRAVPAH